MNPGTVRGGRDKKGPRSQTGAPSLCWWRPYATGPSERRPTTTNKNDHSSRIAPTETAGTRKGPTKGPRSLATLRAGKDLRDEPRPAADATTRPTVAATRSKEDGALEPPSRRNGQTEAPPPPHGTRAAMPSHADRTCRHLEGWPPATPTILPAFSYRMPQFWP